MCVTHHSNYIKYLEEARVTFLDEIGCSYSKLENEKVVSPVVEVLCKYKSTTTFDDSILVNISIIVYLAVIFAFKTKKYEEILMLPMGDKPSKIILKFGIITK